MPETPKIHPPGYHHFVLLLWEERDTVGQHVTWRFSLQDPRKEGRMGFKNFEELVRYLDRWMKSSSEERENLYNPGEEY